MNTNEVCVITKNSTIFVNNNVDHVRELFAHTGINSKSHKVNEYFDYIPHTFLEFETYDLV